MERPSLFSVLFLATSLVGTAGCTSRMASLDVPKVGDRIFQVTPPEVTTLEIADWDPLTGNHWNAQVKRTSANSSGWEIISASDHAPLVDREADDKFVIHLIDTLHTLTVVEEKAFEGPLSTFGLDPPHYVLRWTENNGATRELKLGAFPTGKQEHQRYAQLENRAVVKVQGALIEMLAHLTAFDVLRLRKISTWTTDDIDEVEVWKKGKKELYAQRQGNKWLDAKKRPIRFKKAGPYQEFGDYLEGLTHLRAKEFLDDAEAAAPILQDLAYQPLYRIVFKDRQGNPAVLNVGSKKGNLWAMFSPRGQSVYQLFPESSHLLEAH